MTEREATPAAETEGEEPPLETPVEEPAPEPSWWHRSHPTFAGLVGFFTGVAYVIVVPGVYAALLGLLLSDSSAARLFPLIALALIVPLILLIPRKTRRFAQFMLLGVVATALVIGLTATLVIWVMVKLDG
jgi:energy-coupling factor transporter transmembrane protein EcfT